MDDKYNLYYNAFINATADILKPGFGVLLVFYPFANGAVIKCEMKKGQAHNKEQKGESLGLKDALIKTGAFDRNKCENLKDKTVEGTLYSIMAVNQYYMIKDDKTESWEASRAIIDFQNIVRKAKEQYGKK